MTRPISSLQKVFAAVALAFVLFGLLPSPAVAFDQSSAISFLKARVVDEWGVMALSSAGSLSGTNVDFLKADPGNTPTDIEKRILAIVATGQNPQTFGSVNLVQKLVSHFSGTEIDPSAGLLNDDIFGLLALCATGTNSDIRNSLASLIKQNQNSDGGWGFAKSPTNSDSNDTAMAIMALVANGEGASSGVVGRAFAYLATTERNGGYSFDAMSGFGPDVASTAWVISAILAAGQSVPPAASAFLQSLQLPDGSFSWQPGGHGSALMTAYALIALDNAFYPVRGPGSTTGGGGGNNGGNGSGGSSSGSNSGGAAGQPEFPVSIIGPGRVIFQGALSFKSVQFSDSAGQPQTINQPVALGAVTIAAAQSGFAYIIRNTVLGFFVDTIAGVGPVGNSGWMYAVNGIKPNLGAGQYVLKSGDQVIWFYGQPTDAPPNVGARVSSNNASVSLSANIVGPLPPPPTISLSVTPTQIKLGQSVQLTWSTQNATVLVNSTPDNWAAGRLSGQLNLQPGATTVFLLAVQGPGGVAQQSVTVTVDTSPSVVFGVDTASLDFGDLAAGQQSGPRFVNLLNQGSGNLAVSASLQDADGLYEQGLFLDKRLWNSYQTQVGPGLSKQVALQLRVPSSYEGFGRKNSVLIFFASPQ